MIDWVEVLKVPVDKLLQVRLESIIGKDNVNLNNELQRLYQTLTDESVDLDDENTTIENMCVLFRTSQIIMQAKNNSLIEVQERLNDKSTQLRDQEIELKRLRSSSGPIDPATMDIKNVQDELIEMERKWDSVVRELEGAEEVLEQERLNSSSLQTALKDDKSKIKTLEDSNKRLEVNLRESKMQLSTQRWRLQTRSTDEESQRSTLAQKNTELNKHVEEIQELSLENKQMATELEEVTAELEAAMAEIENGAEEVEVLRSAVQTSKEHMDNLADERDSLRTKVEDLSEKLEGKNGDYEKLVLDLEKKVQKLKSKYKESESEKDALSQEISDLKATIENLRQNEDSNFIDDLRRELHAKDKTVSELRQQLDDSIKDFELLAKDWDRFDSSLSTQKSAMTPTMSTDPGSLKNKIALFNQRRKEDAKRIQGLVDRVTEKESRILEMQTDMVKFEDGSYGLKDAIFEIKQLKIQAKKDDIKMISMVGSINDLEAQSADIAEENYALRAQMRLKPTELDLSNLKLKHKPADITNVYMHNDETSLVNNSMFERLVNQLQLSQENEKDLKHSLILALEKIDNAKEEASNVRSTLHDIEHSKTNLQLKEDISIIKAQCDVLKVQADRNFLEAEKSTAAIAELEKELKQTKNLKSNLSEEVHGTELVISNTNGISSNLDKPIDRFGDAEENLIQNRNTTLETEQFFPLSEKARVRYFEIPVARNTDGGEDVLRNELVKSGEKINALQYQVTALEQTLSTIQLDPKELNSKYVISQRKLIVTEVNEKLLHRRLLATEASEKKTRIEIECLKRDIVELDQAAGQTICLLYQYKSETELHANELAKHYNDSMPLKNFKSLENKLEMYISKTKLLLGRERDQIGNQVEQENYRLKALQLQNSVHELYIKLKESEMKASQFDAIVASGKNTGDYLADTYWRPRYESLVIKAEVFERRADVSELKSKAMIEADSVLRKQLIDTERVYMSTKDEIIKMQESHFAIMNQYEGGATREEFELATSRVETLEMKIRELSLSCEKLKNVSEIASTQASRLKFNQDLSIKESALLHATIKDLQMADDSKFIIGQLHQHILNLQREEMTATNRSREIKGKCLRLEKIIIQVFRGLNFKMESQASGQSKIIFDLRMKTKSRVQLLQKSLSDVRLRLAGSVFLEKHEKACNLAERISSQNSELQLKLESLGREKEEIESKFESMKEKSNMYDELVEGIVDGTNGGKKIALWHSRIVEAQTSKLKCQRELQTERKKFNSMIQDAETSSKRVTELEDFINQIQNDSDLQAMEWEAQQANYEKTVAIFEEERDRIYLATTPSEIKNTLPDRNLPIGEQLEISLRMLVEKGRLVKVSDLKYQQLENKHDSNLIALQQSSHLLNVAHLELGKLQQEVETKKLEKIEQEVDANSIHSDKSRIREANALRFAHESTTSLQRQLAQKNELVVKYRNMLQTIRAELAANLASKDDCIITLNGKVQELTSREIERVQADSLAGQDTEISL